MLSRIMVRTRSMTRRLGAVPTHFYVEDEPWDSSFVMPLDSTSRAYVAYLKRNNVYDLVHSSVPAEYQGHGYGKILAEVNNFYTSHYMYPG